MNILRAKDAARKLGFSVPTLWRKCKEADFPQPIKVSAGVTGWDETELEAWLQRKFPILPPLGELNRLNAVGGSSVLVITEDRLRAIIREELDRCQDVMWPTWMFTAPPVGELELWKDGKRVGPDEGMTVREMRDQKTE